ncbi:MAG: four helix bundle protein [Bacteroidales bacterium]|nr:four helix bundle protein [Bacteroidales bacterium]
MFDFERLDVYQHVKELNVKVLKFIIGNKKMDDFVKDEWKKANMGIILHLTEGTGRLSNSDKKHFLTLSRSCVFECVAILETCTGLGYVDSSLYQELYDDYEKASKMLLGMYRSYDKTNLRPREFNKDFNKDYNKDYNKDFNRDISNGFVDDSE